jgi:DNA-binding response OmpR family regulator
MLVLLFEPDQVRGNHVFDQLRDLDVSLYWVSTVQEADQALFEENFDVVVVDLKSIDGSARRVDFVCELRRKSPGSVFLAVTGDHRDALALDGCVEAIVTEPLDLPALAREIQALGGRQGGLPGRHAVLAGDLYVNFAFQVVELDGTEIVLTSREFAILRTLADQAGAVVSKERIMQSAFDDGQALSSNSLEVHIHRLREKIGRQRIATARGQGYRLMR